MRRRTLIQSLAAGAVAPAAFLARANDGGPVRILCGFAPGGLTDVVARLFAEKLQGELKQPVFVENRPGGGGRLAAQSLKASPPDGRTYMIAPNSGPIFLEILYPRKALGYDLLADLMPVGTLTTYPFGMVIQRSLGVRNVHEFIAWARANPKLALYGTGGAGGQAHFAGTMLAQAAGIEFTSVPYKGNGPVNVDLLGGQIPAAILPASDLMQHRTNPKLQILGLFEDQRSPLVPEVPTFAEQGLKFQVGKAWLGMWAGAKTPRAEIERVNTALKNILSDTGFKEVLANQYTMYPMFHTASEMDRLQRAELEIWRPIIKTSGFRPDQ